MREAIPGPWRGVIQSRQIGIGGKDRRRIGFVKHKIILRGAHAPITATHIKTGNGYALGNVFSVMPFLEMRDVIRLKIGPKSHKPQRTVAFHPTSP